MTRITHTIGNVIHADFTPRPLVKHHATRKPVGVFIKPMGAQESMYMLGGNVSGFMASWMAFHPDFSPSLFGDQMREELGIRLVNDNPEPPDAA